MWLAPPSTSLYGLTIAPHASQHGCQRIPSVELARRHDRRDRGCDCLRGGLSAEPMPPRSIAMATGPEGGGYYEIGKQYQALLARTGVELRLVATAGSVENLALLRDPQSDVKIALVEGGRISKASGELESLGTLNALSVPEQGDGATGCWRSRQGSPAGRRHRVRN